MENFIFRDIDIHDELVCHLLDVRQPDSLDIKSGVSMKPQELLFWIIVGIFVAVLLLLFTNQILFNMLKATVNVKP